MDHITNEEQYNTVFTPDEFIFCKNKKGEIVSCGFQLESGLLQHDTDRFAKNSLPLGIHYIPSDPTNRYQQKYEEEEHDEIDDDLYDKLVMIANETRSKQQKRLTKKFQGKYDKRKTKKLKST